MTKRKSDGGPARGDGEARGVSGDEPRPLPSWARQPMIDSGPSNPPSATLSRNPNIPEGVRVVVGSTAARQKHRIVHGWADHNGMRTVIGSDGRMWVEARSGWREIPTYPLGLEP